METSHPDGMKARVFGVLSYTVAPAIYSIIIPIIVLDIWLTLYQRICFTVYGIPQVRRSEHIRLGRGRLPYLSLLDP